MKYTNKLHILKFLALTLCLAMVVGLLGVTACNAGANGKDGKSAYDIWLEQGNTGTEQDFLDSLKGDKGDQGVQGSKGDKGDQGDSGAKGQNGSQWYLGTSADPAEDPAAVNAVEGDFYLDTKTFTLWQKTSSGWDETGSLKGNDGTKWFSGASNPGRVDMTDHPAVAGSRIGDYYICTDDGTVWKKIGTYRWEQQATLTGPQGLKGDTGADGKSAYDIWKDNGHSGTEEDFLNWLKGEYIEGGDGGDGHDEPEEPGTEITIEAGKTAELPITGKTGVFIVEAETDSAEPITGKITATVESNSSAPSLLVLSESRTEAAGSGNKVYYGFIVIEESDVKVNFSTTEGTVTAKVKLKAWVQPTLKADGVSVEVPVNASNATAEKVIKINVDESVGAGGYTVAIAKEMLSIQDITGVFDQTEKMGYADKQYLVRVTPSKPGTFTITDSLKNHWFVFKPVQDIEALRFIVPATVTLTKA